MQKVTLTLLVLISWLFALEYDKWEQVLEKENITAGAVRIDNSDRDIFTLYYAVKEEGIYVKDSTGEKLLVMEGVITIPEYLKAVNTLLLPRLNSYSTDLYAGTTSGLYYTTVAKEKPITWLQVEGTEELNVLNIVFSQDGLFFMTEEKKLYFYDYSTVKELEIPQETIPGFDIVTATAIGMERFVTDGNEPQPWVVLEFSNGFQRKNMLFALPFEQDSPINMGKTNAAYSQFFYGVNRDFTYAKAISTGNSVTTEFYDEYSPGDGIRKIIFPSGTEITDMTAFDRAMPVMHSDWQNVTSLFFVTTTKGSYAFNMKELTESEEDLRIDDDVDPNLCKFDDTPAITCINSGLMDIHTRQFVINEKGIALFKVQEGTSTLTNKQMTKDTFTKKISKDGIELTFSKSISGSAGLYTLSGKRIFSRALTNTRSTFLPLLNIGQGIYTLSIENNRNIQSQKILIQ